MVPTLEELAWSLTSDSLYWIGHTKIFFYLQCLGLIIGNQSTSVKFLCRWLVTRKYTGEFIKTVAPLLCSSQCPYVPFFALATASRTVSVISFKASSVCGFISIFTDTAIPPSVADAAMERMRRRGPDGVGKWRQEGVFLGHRRLAIIDLDTRAAQPMTSNCGRYLIVFNGEIYNHRELRLELESHGEFFVTTSDTEVVLSLFAREGEAMLPRLKGMFAFVIWDIQERVAFAARDPYGIKPLYLARVSGGVVLASQIKAILATGLVDRASNLRGQAGFWMLGSVPEPHTWFRDIQTVQAGHCLWVREGKVCNQHSWFDISSVWRETAGSRESAIHKSALRNLVRSALIDSIDRHLVSDVPVGVFLSGGIDSAVLAALMAERGCSSLLGITIAYDEYAGRHEDEAPLAALIARHYGLRHHIRRVSRKEFISDLPRILAAMDQPSIDGINTWYASKAAAEQGLKVVISGLGGDELFLGYESFRHLPRLCSVWRAASRVPGIPMLASKAAQYKARQSGEARWNHAPTWLGQGIAGAWWLQRSVLAPEVAELRGGVAVEVGFSPESWIFEMTGALAVDDTLALAQIESTTYMRNQLLRDSDWASMDHSVELRTPLVDASLLMSLKPVLSHFGMYPGKSLLAAAPIRALPGKILHRRKTGFGIPVQRWLADEFGQGKNWQLEVASHFGDAIT